MVDKEQGETEESEIESCEGDMEDRCEAYMDELDGALIEWIECDECGGWWHTFCLCVKKVPNKTFICKKCNT